MYRVSSVSVAAMAGGLLLTLATLLVPPDKAGKVAFAPVPAEEAAPPPPAPPPRPKLVEAQVFTRPGRVDSFTFDSVALNSRKTVNLYLPPGYDEGDHAYPVVYLLRGHEGEWLDDVSSPSRKGRSARKIADELIRSGAMPPVILAMPSLSSDDKEIIALGINLPDPKRLASKHPGIGPGRFEDFLVKEVLPEVDKRYRTLAHRDYRGVDGFSLGGFSAVSLALRFPDLFSSVGAYEASFGWPGGRRPDGQPDWSIGQDMADTFGNPPDLEMFKRYNPIDLIETMAPEQLQRLTFHLQSAHVGSGDSARVAAVVQKLAEKGVTNTFTPPNIPAAKHGWYWADEHLLQALPHHVEAFKKGH